MSTLRLLIVEDDEQDIKTCRDTVERYREENRRDIELVEFRNIDDALKGVDSTFDGAIVDLKFGIQGNEGNQIIRKINESFLRIPIAIFTGNPDNLNETDIENIGIFIKGEATYDEVLDRFWNIYDTGLTRILGGRGIIEENLNRVFLNNLLPLMPKWELYGKADSERTERALLRLTLNHLSHLLDDDEESRFPEEVYLAPPLTQAIRTGSVVRDKQDDRWFVVMTPACDLVVRENGERNTDKILVVEVDPGTSLFPWFEDTELSKNKQGKLRTALRNNYSTYYHWLPSIDSFQGGFLNFRKLFALDENVFSERFETPPLIQIAPSFLKDVVGRFSSYYARQGQPDIDYSEFLSAKSGSKN